MRRSARLAEKQAMIENDTQSEPHKERYPVGSELFKFDLWQSIDYQKESYDCNPWRYPTVTIEIFNKDHSPEEYNEWVACNRYSKQVPLEGQIAEKQNDYQFYVMLADYKDSNQCSNGRMTVFFARKELNHENWPLFQHFFRLLTDPFIYIGYLNFVPQIDLDSWLLNMLTKALRPECNRLKCDQLLFYLDSHVQKLIAWIKHHVTCNGFNLNSCNSPYNDDAMLDILSTGPHCTSAIKIRNCDVLRVVVNFVQKFMDLKVSDEFQMVETIHCCRAFGIEEVLKRNFAKFIVKTEKDYEHTVLLIELINNSLTRKCRLLWLFLTITIDFMVDSMMDAMMFMTFITNMNNVHPIIPLTFLMTKITGIVTLDNDTTVEVFKYLDYCGLAKTILVSKRFCDIICTHRHTLALLDVHCIYMHEYTDINHNTAIDIFDKTLSSEEYNDWVIHNGYSKQIPLEIQIDAMQSTQNERKVYMLSAHADYNDSFHPTKVFEVRIELSHGNWPVFQHFFRLLTDPFVHIRYFGLPNQNCAFNLLAAAINPDYGRLKCHRLDVDFEDNMDRISWIKAHVRCYQIHIINFKLLSINYSGLNDDDEFIDFFMTGGNCTSRISVNFYDPCKAIGNLVQKFMDLKSGDEDKVVGFIECHPDRKINIDVLKRDYADFVVEGNINDTSPLSNLVFDFVNNDIGKKLQLSIRIYLSDFTFKVVNL